MADNTPPSDAELIDELASIVSRTVDLIQLATTGPYTSRSAKKIAKRLRFMGKHKAVIPLPSFARRSGRFRERARD